MKPYKARIQHSCGYPEEQLKESHILTPDEVFSPSLNGFHNFTVTPFMDLGGQGFTFECERAMTRYRVAQGSNGELWFAIAKRNSGQWKTSGMLDGHIRLIEGKRSFA